MLNDAHKLRAIEIYLQCFQQTLENNALLELFCHLVDEPCFDQLRTKEQLGYLVGSGVRRSRGVQGFRVIVQSARKLDHVNQRIELFIDSIRVCRNYATKDTPHIPLFSSINRITFHKCQTNHSRNNVKVIWSRNWKYQRRCIAKEISSGLKLPIISSVSIDVSSEGFPVVFSTLKLFSSTGSRAYQVYRA
jgi:hypothetical protein